MEHLCGHNNRFAFIDAFLNNCPLNARYSLKGHFNGKVATACYRLTTDAARCPGAQSLVGVLRPADEVAAGPLPEGTKLTLSCE